MISPSQSLLELQPAVGASALDQRRCGPARRARQLIGSVARSADRDRCETLALEVLAPVSAQQVAELSEIVLLDQEVCLGPSTFAGARRAPDDRGDSSHEAAVPQVLHLGDRASHRGHECRSVEQVLRYSGGQRIHEFRSYGNYCPVPT